MYQAGLYRERDIHMLSYTHTKINMQVCSISVVMDFLFFLSEIQIAFWRLGVSGMGVGRDGRGSNLQSPMPYPVG